MENAHPKNLHAWVASLTLFTLCACSYVDEVDSSKLAADSQKTSAEGSILLKVPAFNTPTTASISSIELFQFSEGTFVKKLTVDPSKDNIVEFERKPDSRIYALAGYALEGSQKLAEKDFATMTIPIPKDAYSAPIFFSSITYVPEGASNIDIKLHRGVARLDINNADEDFKIERVSISGAASTSQIFATDGRTCGKTLDSYSHAYEASIEGIEEGAFSLFETSSPVSVTISGRRNGEVVEIVSETPAIIRNKIYTVCVYNEENSNTNKERQSQPQVDDEEGLICASIKVTDWVEGDVETGSIDHGESAINIGKSFIPGGVKINCADNTVTVPAEGVSGMKLAFVTNTPLKLGSILSNTESVSINPMAPEATDNGYISRFSVEVAEQPKCAPRYTATVFFHGSSDFFININVDPSPYQIPTVHIGGHDWMCFNATSQNPEEQIFLLDGMSVQKMYKEHFSTCIGNMFQYGSPTPFSPWDAYNPDSFDNQKRDEPWTTKSMIPLPKGYHIPSAAEWQDLIPDGTIIPASYRTPSGDSIRATIVTLPGTLDDTPSAATNAQEYLKRYVLFESVTTSAKLYLPMAGIKTDSSSEIPTDPTFRFDTKSGYWMQERQQVMLLQCEKRGSESHGIQFERHNWHADGLVMIRGIKD